MKLRVALLAFVVAAAEAQQTVAPTPEPVGPVRGQSVDGYNVTNSFELGYRFLSVDGNLGTYRSNVNYGNGIRLLASRLTVHSREGHGRFFDELVLDTQGLGNDPYEYSSLRVEKNRIYRYDLLWRRNEYFNPALRIANGFHFMNTDRRLQDHNFTLLPQSPFRLLVGYTRNAQDGPALSTVNLFDIQGDIFPVFSNVRRLRNEYRLGGELAFTAFRFTVLHGWNNFSETTPFFLNQPSAGENPNDLTTLSQFQRTDPYRGSSPYWLLNLRTENKLWAVGARYTYAGGERHFFFDESEVGTNRFGGARDRQILVSGNGTRPVSAGDLNVSLFPAARLTITNQTSFSNTRINGQGFFQEFNNAAQTSALVNFEFLGIRLITNTTDATYRAANWLALYGGYGYSTRRIESVQGQTVFGAAESVEATQDNRLHDGLFGVRLRPVKPLSVNLDAEIGRADHPFFPISERNYHTLGARVQYRAKTLVLSATARTNYNTNSVSLSSHSSRGRNYGADASWSPWGWLVFDATYSKLHLDTLSGIAYFANGSLITGDSSIYISNIHFGNILAHFTIGKRIGLSVGYSRVQDLGDGRSQPEGTRGGASLQPFLIAQTFPLTYQSPLARFSLKLHEKLRWNVGYQFYDYREKFSDIQNYRANTGYTSLLWSF